MSAVVRSRSLPLTRRSQAPLPEDDVADLKALIEAIKNEKQRSSGESSEESGEDAGHTSERHYPRLPTGRASVNPEEDESTGAVVDDDDGSTEGEHSDPMQGPPPTMVGEDGSDDSDDETKDSLERFMEDDKTLLKVTILSSVEETCFYLPVSLLIDRELEMRKVAQEFSIEAQRWPGSFLFRQWRAMQQQHDEPNPDGGEIRLRLDPENDCSASNQSQNLKWQPWLTNCIRSYYNTGTLRVPDLCDGNDILLALEYFGVMYSPEQLVFDSFAAYLRVKLWSDYFTHRSAMADWVVKQLLSMPSRHSQTFCTSPDAHDNIVHVRSKSAEIFDGGLSLDPERYGDLPSRTVVYDFFNDEELENENSEHRVKLVSLMRADFCSYVQSSLPGTSVIFSVTDVSVFGASGMSVSRRRAVLHIDYRGKSPSPAPTVNLSYRIDEPILPSSSRDFGSDSVRTETDDEFSGVHRIMMFSPNPNIGRKPPRGRQIKIPSAQRLPRTSAKDISPSRTPPKGLSPPSSPSKVPPQSPGPKAISPSEIPEGSAQRTLPMIPSLEASLPVDCSNELSELQPNSSLSPSIMSAEAEPIDKMLQELGKTHSVGPSNVPFDERGRLGSVGLTSVPFDENGSKGGTTLEERRDVPLDDQGSKSVAPSDEHTSGGHSIEMNVEMTDALQGLPPNRKPPGILKHMSSLTSEDVPVNPKAPIQHVVEGDMDSLISGMSESLNEHARTSSLPLAHLLAMDTDDTGTESEIVRANMGKTRDGPPISAMSSSEGSTQQLETPITPPRSNHSCFQDKDLLSSTMDAVKAFLCMDDDKCLSTKHPLTPKATSPKNQLSPTTPATDCDDSSDDSLIDPPQIRRTTKSSVPGCRSGPELQSCKNSEVLEEITQVWMKNVLRFAQCQDPIADDASDSREKKGEEGKRTFIGAREYDSSGSESELYSPPSMKKQVNMKDRNFSRLTLPSFRHASKKPKSERSSSDGKTRRVPLKKAKRAPPKSKSSAPPRSRRPQSPGKSVLPKTLPRAPNEPKRSYFRKRRSENSASTGKADNRNGPRSRRSENSSSTGRKTEPDSRRGKSGILQRKKRTSSVDF